MTGVAWAALAGLVLAGVLLVLTHRRIEHLERADTARKWDLLALRAELGALRGELRSGQPRPRDGAAPAPRRATRADPPAQPTTGPTAWRRSHRRTARRSRRQTY
ncbi:MULTISPECIES: hypothetical protein [Pseudonocardia]|uniref:Secreted protein n=1 Tax=Pseudonocardia saturnea TaxID=33909 RepID=A0ABQ0S243_9PSEU|nr:MULTISPECIES: hypothetical protein [Pseudonocardia]BBG00596.1 hypothetical protein Pdca_18050 [Pseudonocardia autotrophica]GEC26980.1 hypothetical protein PSA01_40090 [Pseudonocardia saturnea]